MDVLTYEGKKYTRNGEKWVDSDSLAVPQYLQKILNTLYSRDLNIDSLSYNECKEEGDKCKKTESYALAVKYYEKALEKAHSSWPIARILPRLTSCYRKLGKPEKVIEVLAYAKGECGEEIISEALLTSAAAAYCDMNEPENALKCCRWAYSVLKIKTDEFSPELANVFERANKMLDPDYSAKESLEKYEEENGIYNY